MEKMYTQNLICLKKKTSVILGLFLFSFQVYAQTYKWSNVAIGGGGFVAGIITSKTQPNVRYARTDVGGAYRWDETNSKWIPLTDWLSESDLGLLGIDGMAMDPNNSQKLYLLAGTSYFSNGKTAILRSSDGGNTFAVSNVTSQFKTHGNGMGRQNGERLAVDPNKGSILFCGTRYNGLFKSIDSGANWTNVTTTGNSTANANGINIVLFDPSSSTAGNATKTIFMAISQIGTNFYKSTDGGASFLPVAGAPTNLMPQRAVLASDKNMYITYADLEGPWNPKSGQIWKYNTTTGTWTNITPSGTTFPFSGISVDPSNPDRVIASTINTYYTQYPNTYGDRFFLSTNGGTSWKDLVGNGITLNPNGCTWITGQSIHWAGCIEFNPFNTAQAFVTSGNGLFVCDNVNSASTTWKFDAIGIEETVPLDLVSIPKGPLVSVIGDYDGFKHTDVTTFAPQHKPTMGTSTGIAYAANNINYLVRLGDKMYYSTNQGVSWTLGTVKGTKGRIAVSADATSILHCPDASSTTYISIDNGSSWNPSSGLNISNAVPVADLVNNKKFYAYNSGNGSMMVSTDGGASFAASGNAGNGGSKNIIVVPGREGHLWVALYGGGLTRSVTSGQSFTKITNVTYCGAVGVGKAATGSNYEAVYIWGTVNGVLGIHRSTDQGATWVRVNDDEHEYGGPGNGQFVIGDMNTYGRVYMSTAGRGIVYGEPVTVTALENENEVENQNKALFFPNPYSNGFKIKSEGDYTYTIFDLSGNIVESGNNQTGEAGVKISVGIYTVKIMEKGVSRFQKIVKN